MAAVGIHMAGVADLHEARAPGVGKGARPFAGDERIVAAGDTMQGKGNAAIGTGAKPLVSIG